MDDLAAGPVAEEIGAMGREIESRHGIGILSHESKVLRR
jgi:hypothetical protein